LYSDTFLGNTGLGLNTFREQKWKELVNGNSSEVA
jgi:hypothetical protein